MAPIGILSLSAWLEQHGHECAVHDYLGLYAPRSLAENVDQILATKPEMVGFSTTTSAFMDAVEMINLIRDRQPAMKVICGGAHVSAVGPTLLQHFPEIDYLCIGEGEGTMRDLADGKPLHEVGNLVYRDGERIVANPRRSRLKELDELPFPAYEKLADFPHDYHLPIFSHIKRWGATMLTSRGCPYTCATCDRTVFERLYKYNSTEYIYAHMKHLRDKFGVHHINMWCARRVTSAPTKRNREPPPVIFRYTHASRWGSIPTSVPTCSTA